MNDLITVIIAVRNGENYLSACIASIKMQNMHVEIIVIDDGSTDGTYELAKESGVSVYRIPHKGLSSARNEGISKSHGEYILFIDHDDIMTNGSLRALYDALQSDRSLDYVQGKLKDFVSPELSEEEKKHLIARRETYGGLLTGSFLFKKSAIENIGGFDASLETGQGVDFLLKAEKQGLKTKKLDIITALRRLHNNNMGRTMQTTEYKDYSRILRMRLKHGGGANRETYIKLIRCCYPNLILEAA